MNVHSIRRSPNHTLNVCARQHMPHPAVGRPKTKTKRMHDSCAPRACTVCPCRHCRWWSTCLFAVPDCVLRWRLCYLGTRSLTNRFSRSTRARPPLERALGLLLTHTSTSSHRFALCSVNFHSQLDYTRTVRTRIVVHRNSRRGSVSQRTVGAR